MKTLVISEPCNGSYVSGRSVVAICYYLDSIVSELHYVSHSVLRPSRIKQEEEEEEEEISHAPLFVSYVLSSFFHFFY
jgi:hypothetical protein